MALPNKVKDKRAKKDGEVGREDMNLVVYQEAGLWFVGYKGVDGGYVVIDTTEAKARKKAEQILKVYQLEQ